MPDQKRIIETIILPKQTCYNIAIFQESILIADSNNSSSWFQFKLKLPKGKWKIISRNENRILIEKEVKEND